MSIDPYQPEHSVSIILLKVHVKLEMCLWICPHFSSFFLTKFSDGRKDWHAYERELDGYFLCYFCSYLHQTREFKISKKQTEIIEVTVTIAFCTQKVPSYLPGQTRANLNTPCPLDMGGIKMDKMDLCW